MVLLLKHIHLQNDAAVDLAAKDDSRRVKRTSNTVRVVVVGFESRIVDADTRLQECGASDIPLDVAL